MCKRRNLGNIVSWESQDLSYLTSAEDSSVLLFTGYVWWKKLDEDQLDLWPSLHTVHFSTHTHTYVHTYTQQPPSPCERSRNSTVKLSGKQTLRGCWESPVGLQITVWLTRVSEPALYCYTHTNTRTHTHTGMHVYTHILKRTRHRYRPSRIGRNRHAYMHIHTNAPTHRRTTTHTKDREAGGFYSDQKNGSWLTQTTHPSKQVDNQIIEYIIKECS